MKKISDFITWDEFLNRYLINHEEFIFYHKSKKINLCYGREGKFSYNIIVDGQKVFEEEFCSPKDLLINARIDGKTLKQIYYDLL